MALLGGRGPEMSITIRSYADAKGLKSMESQVSAFRRAAQQGMFKTGTGMASNLAQGINSNTRQVHQAGRNLVSVAQKHAVRLGGTFQQLGFQAQLTGMTLTRAFTAPVVAAVGFGTVMGVKLAARLESARVALQALLPVGYNVNALIVRLRKTAIQSPVFNTPQLVDFTRKLVSTGVEVKKSEAIIGSLGKVFQTFGVTGEGVELVLKGVGQAFAKGRLYSEELNQQIGEQIPALKLLARAAGVTQGEFLGMVSEGEITADVFADLLVKMGKFPEVNRGAAGALHTMSSAFDRLKESMFDALALTWLKYSPQIQKGLDDLGKQIPGLGDAFAKLVPKLVNGFTAIVSGIKGALRWYNSLDKSQQKLVGTLALVAVAAGPVIIILGKLATGMGAIATIASAALNPLGLLAVAFGALIAFGLIKWLKDAGDGTDVFATALDKAADAFDRLTGKVRKAPKKKPVVTEPPILHAPSKSVFGKKVTEPPILHGNIPRGVTEPPILTGNVPLKAPKALTKPKAATDWEKVGRTIGRAIVRGLFDALDKLAPGGDWVEAGKKVGGKAVGFAVGFMAGLGDELFTVKFWKKHWWDVIVATMSIFGVGKLLKPVAKVITKIPWGKLGALIAKIPWARIFGPLTKVAGVVGRFFSRIFGAIGRLVDKSLGGLPRKVGNAFKAIIRIPARIGRFFLELGKILGLVLREIFPIIDKAIEDLGIRFLYGIDALRKVVGKLGQRIINFFAKLFWYPLRQSFKTFSGRVLAFLGRFFGIQALVDEGKNLVVGLINGIREKAKELWDRLRKIWRSVVNSFKRFFGISSPSKVMANLGKDLMRGLSNGIMALRDRLVGNIRKIKNRIIDIFRSLGKYIKENVPAAFRKGVSLIGQIWDKIRKKALTPVNFIIDPVYNKGIRKPWNAIAGFLGLKSSLPKLNKIKMESGGEMPSKPMGSFTKPTAIVGEGNTNAPEYVIPTEPKYRKQALKLYESLGGRLMAGGGILGFLTNPAGWLKDQAKSKIDAIADKFGSNGMTRLLKGLPKMMLREAIPWFRRQLARWMGGGGGKFLGGPSGSSISVIAALARRFYPGARVSSGYRPGDPGYHGKGLAADLIGGGTAGMNAIARGFYRISGRLLEEIHSPSWFVKNGRRVSSAFYRSVYGQHFSHVHIAAYRNALLPLLQTRVGPGFVADNGTVLSPGWNLRYNGTGQAEPLRPFRGGRGGGTFHVTLMIGDRTLGELLIDPLRHSVRTRGGDVQAVIGRTKNR
jgi:tape measure domain-containing protein